MWLVVYYWILLSSRQVLATLVSLLIRLVLTLSLGIFPIKSDRLRNNMNVLTTNKWYVYGLVSIFKICIPKIYMWFWLPYWLRYPLFADLTFLYLPVGPPLFYTTLYSESRCDFRASLIVYKNIFLYPLYQFISSKYSLRTCRDNWL